ncbi:MAG TPA: class I SAM-dependent methyltransferase [Solirubrobacterales bacterium]
MTDASVVWHEAECGSYGVDLPLWGELATDRGDPVLDLGCGTGRVALHLARHGQVVTALDSDAVLVAALRERSVDLPLDAVVGDVRRLELGTEFALVLLPMQLVQLLSDAAERAACLGGVAAHLAPGGLAALAIVESMPEPVDGAPPLPDTREVDGWVYSSLPIDAVAGPSEIRVRRLRQTVSPEGALEEELHEIGLRALDAATLEGEAESAGLQPAGRRAVPPTADHVGSTVVLLEKAP